MLLIEIEVKVISCLLCARNARTEAVSLPVADSGVIIS